MTYTQEELKLRPTDIQPGVWIDSNGPEVIIGPSPTMPNEFIVQYERNGELILATRVIKYSYLALPGSVPAHCRKEWEAKLAELRPISKLDPHAPIDGVTLYRHGTEHQNKYLGSYVFVDGKAAGYWSHWNKRFSSVLSNDDLENLSPAKAISDTLTEDVLRNIRTTVRSEREKSTLYSLKTFPKGIVWIREVLHRESTYIVESKHPSGITINGINLSWQDLADNYELSFDELNWEPARNNA